MPVIDLKTTEIKEPVPGYRVRFVHSVKYRTFGQGNYGL